MKNNSYTDRLLSHSLIKTNHGYEHHPECKACKVDFWLNIIAVISCAFGFGFYLYLMFRDF